MENFLNNLEQIETEVAKILAGAIRSIYKAANKVLPKGDADQSEIDKFIRACTPDTYEWFDAKFQVIAELDTAKEMLECICEWQEYITQKADEYITRNDELIKFQQRLMEDAMKPHWRSCQSIDPKEYKTVTVNALCEEKGA